MKKIFVKIIELYQTTLSPDSGWISRFYPGGYCKYTPNCSEYCKLSIIKHGTIKGGLKGLYRLVRCNPWSHGGFDPVE